MKRPAAIDPKQQRDAEKAERMAEEQDRTDAAKILGSPEGQRFVRRILDNCGAGLGTTAARVYDSTGRTDSVATAYEQGRRSVGEGIIADLISLAPRFLADMCAQMISEEAQRREEDAREAKQKKGGVDPFGDTGDSE